MPLQCSAMRAQVSFAARRLGNHSDLNLNLSMDTRFVSLHIISDRKARAAEKELQMQVVRIFFVMQLAILSPLKQ